MSIIQSLSTIWRQRAGKLAVIFVVLCVVAATYTVYSSRGNNTAINKSQPKTNTAPQNGLLPVTTTPSTPDTSSINSPGNVSGQNLQPQPNSAPSTVSPQQAAPQPSPVETSPPVTSTPVQPISPPVTPHCAPCGGIRQSGVTSSAYMCPQYCVE